jgi:hypothetical protein
MKNILVWFCFVNNYFLSFRRSLFSCPTPQFWTFLRILFFFCENKAEFNSGKLIEILIGTVLDINGN